MLTKLILSLLALAAVRCWPYATRSTYAGPVLLAVVTLTAWAHRLTLAWSWWDALAAAMVIMSWPLVEPAFHKFLLHAKDKRLLPVRNHRLHHRHPTAYNGLTPMYHACQFAAGAWVLSDRPIASTVLGVYLILYLAYEVFHYAIHCGRGPRRMREHHLYHHNHPREKYGVTMPWL